MDVEGTKEVPIGRGAPVAFRKAHLLHGHFLQVSHGACDQGDAVREAPGVFRSDRAGRIAGELQRGVHAEQQAAREHEANEEQTDDTRDGGTGLGVLFGGA